MKEKKDIFIVEFWSRIFSILSHISVFAIIRRIFPKCINHKFVDYWVLSHLILSLVSIPIVIFIESEILKLTVASFSILRVFEIIVYQTNVLLFDEYRAKKQKKIYEIRGYRRIVLLLIHNYFEIIFWFATQYVVFNSLFTFAVPESHVSFLGAIYTSFVVMTSFGFANITPLSVLAYTIVISQAMIGLFMTLLSLARFISLIPNPKTMDEFEQ